MRLAEFLERLPYFTALPHEDLERLADRAPERTVPAGEVLLEEGSPSDAMYVVLSGDFEVTRASGDRQVPIGRARAGDVLGEISLLEGAPRNASARATMESRVAEIDQEEFQKLLANPASLLAMLHTVLYRLRTTEATLRDSVKLTALGTMTAGLLHELNNPAAAVRRAAAAFVEAFEAWRALSGDLQGSDLLPGPSGPAPYDPLERADRIGEIERWLEGRGIDEPWQLAPALVAEGWEAESLEQQIASVPPDRAGNVLRWLALGRSLDLLLEELRTGAARISELVGAVKSYSYKDQGATQIVDVHQGLEDTIVMLRHVLEPGITVRREYASEMPELEVFGAELNQVWTNLIANAAEAMDGKGTLELRTSQDATRVMVEIADDGPGIPEDVQRRIFEPFYTTKPPGMGTGLGLYTAYSVIAQHGGDITVDSRPGRTIFRVSLPKRVETVG